MMKIYKWLIGFIGAMIMAWLGNFFYDRTKDIPVLNKVTSFFNWLYDRGIAVLNYQIKVWVILVALVGCWLIYRWLKFATKEVPPPDFTNYKKDVFKNWIWRWDWKLTPNAWAPINLTPYCPKDDVQLIANGDIFHSRFYCPKCGIQYDGYNNKIETATEAEVLLLDKVNKNTYLTKNYTH